MNYNAIDLTDLFSLVAVWELTGNSWKLVSITRLQQAIALSREAERLVFPTHANPNLIWRKVGPKCPTDVEVKERVSKQASSQSQVLDLLDTHPGQSVKSISTQLGISIEAARWCLRSLKKQGRVHCRPNSLKPQEKVYYLGATPISTSISAPAKIHKVALPTWREPPLKIYFVDPRTLQGVNR